MPDHVRAIGEDDLKRTICPRHPQYRGLRKPRLSADCNQCVAIFEFNRALGIREYRRKKNITDDELRKRHEHYLKYQKLYNQTKREKQKEIKEKEALFDSTQVV